MDQYFEYSFRRRIGTATEATTTGYTVDGITHTVETVDKFTNIWKTGPVLIEQLGSPIDNGDGTETVTVRLCDKIEATKPQGFIRLRVE